MSFMFHENEFSYNRFQKYSFEFRKETVALEPDSMYGDRLHSFGALSLHESKLLRLKVNSNPLIFHYCNDSVSDLIEHNKIEYFSYNNQKVCFDSLLNNSANGVKRRENEFYVFTGIHYYFSFKGTHYTILHCVQRGFLRNSLRYCMILLEIEGRFAKNSYAFIDAPEDTPGCFGDFNQDGKLDYLDWRKLENRVSMFTLVDNRFIKDENHYIIVKPSKAQQIYRKQYDDEFNYRVIDKNNSNWFYKL